MRRGEEKKLIEDPIREAISAMDGTAELFRVPGKRGPPDLLVTLPFQPMHFVECKKPKRGKLSALQRKDHDRRRSLGQEVYVIWTIHDRDAYIQRQRLRVMLSSHLVAH